MRFKFVFSSFLLALFGFSQRVELKTIDPIMCFNENNGQLTLIDDTNWVKTYSIHGTLLSSFKILSKEINMLELKQDFIPMILHKKLHFVERGCGRVFKFNKGFIERVDRSFSHRNQFDALLVEIRDTLFCIGGYGFFTVKDHVTYFDERVGQWFLKNNSFLMNYQILNPLYYLEKDGITIYGGDTYINGIVSDDLSKRQEKLLKFSLISNRWEEVGFVNDDWLKHMKNISFVGKNTLVSLNHVLYFNPSKNSVYLRKNTKDVLKLFSFNGKLIENKMIRISYDMYVNTIDFYDFNQYFSQKNTSVFHFLKQKRSPSINQSRWYYWLFGLLIFSILLFIYLIRKRKRAESCEIPQEVLLLLAVWVEKENQTLELVDLNALVSYDNPELETLKKRRESMLKRLKQFLVDHEKFTEEEVYSTELNPRDKRIKRLKLHPKAVKWYNRVK